MGLGLGAVLLVVPTLNMPPFPAAAAGDDALKSNGLFCCAKLPVLLPPNVGVAVLLLAPNVGVGVAAKPLVLLPELAPNAGVVEAPNVLLLLTVGALNEVLLLNDGVEEDALLSFAPNTNAPPLLEAAVVVLLLAG